MSFRPDATIQLLIDSSANPLLGTRTVSVIMPQNGTINYLGHQGGGNAIGTTTTPDVDTSATITSYPYINLLSAAPAGSTAGVGVTKLTYGRGSATGCGGFRMNFIVGTKSAVAAQAAFWGLQSTNTSSFNSTFNYATTNPDQQVDCVGVGYNTGETNLYVMHNDAAGACTRVNLGANFPVDSSSLYRCEFWCATGSSATIFYRITRLNDGTKAEGELTTDLPTAGTNMGPRFAVANRATASAVTLALAGCVIQAPA